MFAAVLARSLGWAAAYSQRRGPEIPCIGGMSVIILCGRVRDVTRFLAWKEEAGPCLETDVQGAAVVEAASSAHSHL
jgi:hypothetical protein